MYSSILGMVVGVGSGDLLLVNELLKFDKSQLVTPIDSGLGVILQI